MVRTSVVLDESRVNELRKLMGARTKAEAVREAVEAAIRRAKVLRLQKLREPLYFDPVNRPRDERRRRRSRASR